MIKFVPVILLLLSGCTAQTPEPVPVKETSAKTILQPELRRNRDGSIVFSTLYWVTRPLTQDEWHAVFGGTVVEIEKAGGEKSGEAERKYVAGKLKIEKIFLNLPANSEIKIGSLIESEDFDGLKTGDKVIVFINGFYEGDFVRAEIEGTNSKLGLKIKDWNEPIVAALEKIAACNKIEEIWAEGHPEASRVKMYDCANDRNRGILDDPQISEIWKRYDPKGFRYLVEMRELEAAEK